MIESLLTFFSNFPAFGLLVLLVLGALGFPFPEDATLILCGFLISQKLVYPAGALLLVYLGLLATDAALYYAGWKYGRLIVTHRLFHRFLSPQKLAVLEDRFSRKGLWIILLGRHLIGLKSQILLVAGVMRMRYVTFLLYDAVSALITMAIMVGIGYGGGSSLQVLRRNIVRMEYVMLLVACVAVTCYLLYKYFKSRREGSL